MGVELCICFVVMVFEQRVCSNLQECWSCADVATEMLGYFWVNLGMLTIERFVQLLMSCSVMLVGPASSHMFLLEHNAHMTVLVQFYCFTYFGWWDQRLILC